MRQVENQRPVNKIINVKFHEGF